MKQSFTQKCGLALLLMLFAFVQGSWAKSKPTITFTGVGDTPIETTVSGSITTPKFSVTDPGSTTGIRAKFRYTYNIVAADGTKITTISKDNGKDVTVDPTTGSTVQLRYGVVRIGKYSGTFKVRVTATPTSNYAGSYDETYAEYTVKVNPAEASLAVTQNGKTYNDDDELPAVSIYKYYGNPKSTSNALPTVAITHKLNGKNVNDNDLYKITWTFATGNSFQFDDANKPTKYSTTDCNNASEGTLTITATPTEEGKKIAGDKIFTRTLKVKSTILAEGKTLATTISFPKQEVSHYRNWWSKNAGYNFTYPNQMPIILDANGNDVTNCYELLFGSYDSEHSTFKGGWEGIPGQSVLYNYSKDPFDFLMDPWNSTENNKVPTSWKVRYTDGPNNAKAYIYGTNQPVSFQDNSHNYPDDYIVGVQAKVKGEYANLYQATPNTNDIEVKGQVYGNEKEGKENQNKYNIKSDEYVFHLLKRKPKLLFDPDPTERNIVLANKWEMTPENRFKVSGYFHDETMPEADNDSIFYDDKNGHGKFGYCYFIPDSYKWQSDADDNPTTGIKIKIREGSWSVKLDDVYQYIYKTDSEGKPTNETELAKGSIYFSKQNWGNDNMLITFYGTGYIPMYYYIYPSNQEVWDVGDSQTFTYQIKDAEPTYLIIEPKEIITSTGVTSEVPTVKVVDQFGADVTDQFDLTPTKADADEDKTTLTLGTDENGEGANKKYAVTSSENGEFVITVTATPKSTNKYYEAPTPDTYTVIVKNSGEALYEVIYDDREFNTSNGLNDKMSDDGSTRTNNESKMGKLHFIKEGTFTPGTTSIREVPGLTIRFGNAAEAKEGFRGLANGYAYNVVKLEDENTTALKDNENDKVNSDSKLDRYYLHFDGTDIPEGEELPDYGYIELEPVTNGFLTIDAYFHGNEDWIVKDMSTKELAEMQLTNETRGEKTFGLPLLAGHRYALWSDQMEGWIHGISFDPAFIALKTDHYGWHTAVTFRNGYTGALPKLRDSEHSTVSYYLRDVSQKGEKVKDIASGNSGYHASVDGKTGAVSALQLTSDNSLTTGTSGTGAEMANRVTIIGKVLGENKGDGKQVEKRPHYNLFIGNMPTYIVEDGANFDQGNRISTNNIPTRIWMTIGGWVHMNDQNYPYRKESKGAMMVDGWNTAKMDSVGRDQMTIDDFNYGSAGDQNPLDEDVASWNSFRKAKPWNEAKVAAEGSTATLDDQRNTFHVPVRGTYLKFEPEESGKLFLYVLQNGMTDVSKGDATNKWDDDDATYLRRRALYIIDETGNNVQLEDNNDGWSGMDQYLAQGANVTTRYKGYTIPHQNYYCDGMTRVGWADQDHPESSETGYKTLTIDETPTGKYSWLGNYDHTGEKSSIELTPQGKKNLDADVNLIKEWWTKGTYDGGYAHSKLEGPNEVLKLSDGGYVLPTKGYVRYTFDVKAGKTYFVFINGSKLGFCGFGFLPEGYTRDANPWLNAAGQNDVLDDKSAFKSEVYKKLPEPKDLTSSNSKELYNGTTVGGTDDIVLDANLAETDAKSYKGQLSTIISSTNAKKDHQFVNVVLKRTFRNKHWSGICLPFSVSEKQVKEVFGPQTIVITFDSVRGATNGLNRANGLYEDQSRTVHFTRHVSQLIEAGRPYFIYPDSATLDAGKELTYDGTNIGVRFTNVTFEGKPAKDIVCYNEDAINTGTEIFTYQAVGIYDKTPLPWYSYYMNSTKGTNGLLVRSVPKSSTAKLPNLVGYNTYLRPYSEDNKGDQKLDGETSNAKLATFWIRGGEVNGGDNVTAIDEIVDDLNQGQTNFVDGVYTIDGVKVSSKNSLEGLTPGVYIMGGKKYTVK